MTQVIQNVFLIAIGTFMLTIIILVGIDIIRSFISKRLF
jgi:hypothetical protein